MAVKVTGVPAQTLFPDDTIETLTGNTGSTVDTNEFDCAGLPVLQARLDVMRA
jgi:hypothetical protein